VTADRVDRRKQPAEGEKPRPAHEGTIPLGALDPTIIHRARAVNADALRVIDELLDQLADSGPT
jgi:hypothetical protein